MMDEGKEKANAKISEDYCFACKGGGTLCICALKNCPKAYHIDCAVKNKLFSTMSGICEWHICFVCQEPSMYQCYCCPKAVCQNCIGFGFAESALVRGTKGFCIDCLYVLLDVKGKKAAYSEGPEEDKVNVLDKNTLLYEYWLVIKAKENLSLEHLHLAEGLLLRDESLASLSNASGTEKYGHDGLVSPVKEEDMWQKEKRSTGETGFEKWVMKSKNREFIGWGSKPLIYFLESVGKDTSKEIPQLEVDSIIIRYAIENNLIHAAKKKIIVCDERLKILFGKNTIRKNNINKLLELHYRENAELHEQDQQDYSSEEENENGNASLASKKQRKESEVEVVAKVPQSCLAKKNEEVDTKVPQSCFASIVVDNIKLVYLRKCLVMQLLEEPENIDSMVIGSFVKVKYPNDLMQKIRYQLVQVTGVKNTSPKGKKEDILLQALDRFDDFPISMLFDGNVSEEDCQDLNQRVNSGQLPKPTIVEMEKKAKLLHVLVTKDRIVKELAMLQNQIDRANEKGWREKLFEYIERKELLETEAEQKRLLEEVPKVIAEVLEVEPISDDDNQGLKQGYEIPPESILSAD